MEITGSEKNERNNLNFPFINFRKRWSRKRVRIDSYRCGDKKSVDSGAREVAVIKINIPNICESSGTSGGSKVRGGRKERKSGGGYDVVSRLYAP